MDSEPELLSRRHFIARTATYAGGLVEAFHLPKFLRSEAAFAAPPGGAPVAYPPNAFLRIAPDNSITLTVNRLEMGQGVNTAFAQLVAEELGCPWENIRAVQSSADTVYNTPGMPFIITGGSMSVRTSWEQYRKIGAGMREMLKTAAARRWGVGLDTLRVNDGKVLHAEKGALSFGELAQEASLEPFPENPPLKAPRDFKLIGQSLKRIDADVKSNGQAVFGLDVRLPGMLYAIVAKPPLEGAKLVSFDEHGARRIRGVVDVVPFAGRVAVLAKNSHAAHLGQAALKPQWDNGDNAKASTDTIMQGFRSANPAQAPTAENRGEVERKMGAAAHKAELEYEFPFLAHAPMEPMNCTVNYDGHTADIYGGMQMPTNDLAAAARTLGLPPEKINMHVTYAGGSFGRRANKVSDYVVEACALAKIVKKPLKVVWSREDDMRGGYYRPMNFHRVTLGLDKKHRLLAWDHHVVGQSLMKGSIFEKMMVKDGVEDAIVEGVKGTPYAFADFRVRQTRVDTPMTTLWWRSVGNTHTAYVMETAVDELAELGGHDPLEFRLGLLNKSPKHQAVLRLLKKETGWGRKKPPHGRAWGLAIHESFQSIVAQVAEVSLVDGFPRVHQVWCAADVGQVVNPAGVASQIEGGVIFGLSAVLRQEITLKDGQIVQGGFLDYPVLRMQDSPSVSVFLVPSHEHPTGIGEPGVPPIGPAVANAVYRLTGHRVRRLPFTKGMKA